MASRPVPPESIQKATQLLIEGKLTRDEIARQANLSQGYVSNLKAHMTGTFDNLPSIPEPIPEVVETDIEEEIRHAIQRNGCTVDELADKLDCGPSKIREALESMKVKGSMIVESFGKYEMGEAQHIEAKSITITGQSERTFGALGDGHLCNKHSRLDVHEAAYTEYARRGIKEVFHTGNMVDGEARFNKTELIVRPGMQAQADYAIDNYPHREGITTYFIDGDDHEGWYMQREGIQFGAFLQYEAEKQGRHDLKYLGYGECDVEFKMPNGSACGRIVHPGGGSSYALSYTSQKRVESYTGGEKPHFEIAGHYHKFCLCYPRDVWCLDTGCMCDQTMFMRKKKLAAHVGFTVVNISQSDDGALTRFAPEFFPFYDRKYYERRF